MTSNASLRSGSWRSILVVLGRIHPAWSRSICCQRNGFAHVDGATRDRHAELAFKGANKFVVIGREVTQANKTTFTYNTDDLVGPDSRGTTWTDESNTPFTQVKVAGTGVGQEPVVLDFLRRPGGVGTP